MPTDDRFQKARSKYGHIDPVRPEGLLFVPFRLVDDVLHLSGELPFLGPPPLAKRFAGKVGDRAAVDAGTAVVDVDAAAEAASVTTLNLLFTAKAALGTLDNVVRTIEAFGVVNSDEGFTGQSQVMNGCSSVLLEVFGEERGQHTRCAIGVSELPLNSCIEIKLSLHIDCVGLAASPDRQ
ncbi:MAG TPA: RidA family protein [Pirellulaceae bacterium]|nr:RidA family protein [Pirellulaceae bacterium]